VWLDGQGWIRVDPTSAVAPERIEEGLEFALRNEEKFLSNISLSWMKYRQTLWLTEIRLQLGAIGHYWDTWVVGYTPSMQMNFLTRYLGEMDLQRLGLIMLAAFFSLLAIVSLFVLAKRSHKLLQPVDREYLRFCRYLENQGLRRRIGEGPLHYASRVSQSRPELESAINAVTHAYVQMNYIEDQPDETDILKRAIRAFRLRALGANTG
jgi:hypothetical protein